MTETNSSNPTGVNTFSFQTWRESFVRIILIWASVFGFIAFVATFFNSNEPLYEFVYAAAFASLLAVTFIRMPYLLRAGVFLALMYILGLSGLFETGIWGDARVFFLAFVIMCALLISPRAGINAMVFCIITITIFGFLTLNGYYLLSSQEVTNGSLGDWLTGSASLVLLGAVAVAGLYFFQSEFVQAQARASETFSDLQAERKNLEKHVAERTDELERRNISMRSTVYFISQIAELQDLSAIPAKTVDLISQHFGHYNANLFLMDEDGKTAVLQASSSDAGRKLLDDGYHVKVGDRSLVGRVAERAKLLISTNNSTYPSLDTPASAMSQQVLAEIALPLLVRGKVTGVLDIQSEKSDAFNQNEAEILQLLADQVAAAIDNARLLSGSQTLVSQLRDLTSQETHSTWREYLINQKLAYQFTPMGIKSITPGTSLKNHNSLHIPLILRGQEIGSISLQRKDMTDWAGPDQNLAKKVAIQVALALDNSRLLEETRQHAVQEQTVNEITARLNRSLDVDTLLQTAVREFASLPEVAEASVYIKPSDEEKINNQM
jgi:GAF domain-containing protein